MEKKWIIRSKPDFEKVQHIQQELDISSSVAEMLVSRGINNFESAKAFFRPKLDHLNDPVLMHDMSNAVKRLQKAVDRKEKVLIYGDYDVDGTTAVALCYSYFSLTFEEIDYYIPDRYEEGYGISLKSIDFAAENNFSLIVALDCGIKAVDKVAYAKEKNIDYIICDHHRPGDELPEAIVLDPKKSSCNYPYKELSGCGIGFKMVQAFHREVGGLDEDIWPYLDYCAISIAADIVPLTGENRILAYFGLRQINSNPRPGVKALLKERKKEITIADLVFGAAPQINAAGRIESGKSAVHLLIAKDDSIAEKACQLIQGHNKSRKEHDQQITQEALEMIQSSEERLAANTTVVFKEDWHKGVVGIVASRLMETYYRPTIVLTESNGKVTGSARSVKNYDIYNALEACEDFLEQFGGHKYAAGMTLSLDNIEAFTEKFESVVSQSLDPELLVPEIKVERIINFSEIFQPGDQKIPKFYRVLKQFAPFGPENMRPLFVTKGVKASNLKVVGEKHLKATFYQESSPEIQMEAIAFGMGKLYEKMLTQAFHLAYTLEENHWNNKVTLQVNVKDVKFGELNTSL